MLDAMGFQPGFHVLPRRWVVERTFAWVGRYRRLANDYERLSETSQTLIYIAMSRLIPSHAAPSRWPLNVFRLALRYLS